MRGPVAALVAAAAVAAFAGTARAQTTVPANDIDFDVLPDLIIGVTSQAVVSLDYVNNEQVPVELTLRLKRGDTNQFLATERIAANTTGATPQHLVVALAISPAQVGAGVEYRFLTYLSTTGNRRDALAQQEIKNRFAIQSEAPTAAPAAAPTALPTAPTAAPTAIPSPMPSHAPTASPTRSPLAAPTVAPTPNPTTSVPTTTPTMAPSEQPTNAPTASPSASPSAHPTTAAPTPAPSTQPTTPEPTTAGPTTAAPSDAPSVSPSAQTTRQPTAAPTTHEPTAAPSVNPTRSPTSEPTTVPTQFPTLVPSATPTPAPTTADPTSVPPSTAAPSTAVTTATSSSTSSSTSTTQTDVATPEPTTAGPTTAAPSDAPSVSPSAQPTRQPTAAPTTREPTAAPSGNPTRSPTSEPTTAPSQSPTDTSTAATSDTAEGSTTPAVPTTLSSTSTSSTTMEPLTRENPSTASPTDAPASLAPTPAPATTTPSPTSLPMPAITSVSSATSSSDAPDPATNGSGCEDTASGCADHAADGWCESTGVLFDYMAQFCRISCGLCGGSSTQPSTTHGTPLATTSSSSTSTSSTTGQSDAPTVSAPPTEAPTAPPSHAPSEQPTPAPESAPVSASPSPGPTLAPTPACADSNPSCPSYKDIYGCGAASVLHSYMIVACKDTCGLCSGAQGGDGELPTTSSSSTTSTTTTPEPECADVLAQCKEWHEAGHGFCSPSSLFFEYMSVNCRRTCGQCQDPSTTTTAAAASSLLSSSAATSGVTTEAAGSISSAECVDNDGRSCVVWASSDFNYCSPDSRFSFYMSMHCRRTCGLCTDGSLAHDGTVPMSFALVAPAEFAGASARAAVADAVRLEVAAAVTPLGGEPTDVEAVTAEGGNGTEPLVLTVRLAVDELPSTAAHFVEHLVATCQLCIVHDNELRCASAPGAAPCGTPSQCAHATDPLGNVLPKCAVGTVCKPDSSARPGSNINGFRCVPFAGGATVSTTTATPDNGDADAEAAGGGSGALGASTVGTILMVVVLAMLFVILVVALVVYRRSPAGGGVGADGLSEPDKTRLGARISSHRLPEWQHFAADGASTVSDNSDSGNNNNNNGGRAHHAYRAAGVAAATGGRTPLRGRRAGPMARHQTAIEIAAAHAALAASRAPESRIRTTTLSAKSEADGADGGAQPAKRSSQAGAVANTDRAAAAAAAAAAADLSGSGHGTAVADAGVGHEATSQVGSEESRTAYDAGEEASERGGATEHGGGTARPSLADVNDGQSADGSEVTVVAAGDASEPPEARADGSSSNGGSGGYLAVRDEACLDRGSAADEAEGAGAGAENDDNNNDVDDVGGVGGGGDDDGDDDDASSDGLDQTAAEIAAMSAELERLAGCSDHTDLLEEEDPLYDMAGMCPPQAAAANVDSPGPDGSSERKAMSTLWRSPSTSSQHGVGAGVGVGGGGDAPTRTLRRPEQQPEENEERGKAIGAIVGGNPNDDDDDGDQVPRKRSFDNPESDDFLPPQRQLIQMARRIGTVKAESMAEWNKIRRGTGLGAKYAVADTAESVASDDDGVAYAAPLADDDGDASTVDGYACDGGVVDKAQRMKAAMPARPSNLGQQPSLPDSLSDFNSLADYGHIDMSPAAFGMGE